MMGSFWPKILANSMSNPFWKECLIAWNKFLDKKKPFSPTDALSSPMWYNSQSFTESLFFPHWYNARICVPLDIAQIQQQFFLEYLRIQRCLKHFVVKCDIHHFSIDRPIFPPYLKIQLNHNKGSQHFYEILKDQHNNQK